MPEAIMKENISSSPQTFILPHTIKPKAVNEWHNYSVSYCLGACWIFFNLNNLWRISKWELPDIFIMKYIKREKNPHSLNSSCLSLLHCIRFLLIPLRNMTFCWMLLMLLDHRLNTENSSCTAVIMFYAATYKPLTPNCSK